jgi:hypothetical protein
MLIFTSQARLPVQFKQAPSGLVALRYAFAIHARVITHRSPNDSFRTRAGQVADREGEKCPLRDILVMGVGTSLDTENGCEHSVSVATMMPV